MKGDVLCSSKSRIWTLICVSNLLFGDLYLVFFQNNSIIFIQIPLIYTDLSMPDNLPSFH